jgi:mannose-6-phosphate isomerase-like protein (cupin superfamily)
MADSLTLCTVADSGWRPEMTDARVDFKSRGKDLIVELRQWHDGEALNVALSEGDELGAVLSGQFELWCGDERHVLDAGTGILIPRGEAHRWRLLSKTGTLYRVTSA